MEIYTGKILFPTTNTYEHLLMMEKVTESFFPTHMVENIRNREVKPLFNLQQARPGSLIRQPSELKEQVDMSTYRKLVTLNVGRSHAGVHRPRRQPETGARPVQRPDEEAALHRPRQTHLA